MKLLKGVVCKFAGFLSKSRPGEASIGTTAFTAVQDALNLFADEAGVAKLCDSLSRWFKNSEKHLAASELMAICRSYPEDLQAPMNASNLGAFIDHGKTAPGMSSRISRVLRRQTTTMPLPGSSGSSQASSRPAREFSTHVMR